MRCVLGKRETNAHKFEEKKTEMSLKTRIETYHSKFCNKKQV